MKKRIQKKKSKQAAQVMCSTADFIGSLVDRVSELYAEVEQYHRLKEHLLIVPCTKQRRYILESDDPELHTIYTELDKALFQGDGQSSPPAE